MAFCVAAAAALAFTLPSAPTRREMLVASSGLAVTSFTVVPQAAALGKQFHQRALLSSERSSTVSSLRAV